MPEENELDEEAVRSSLDVFEQEREQIEKPAVEPAPVRGARRPFPQADPNRTFMMVRKGGGVYERFSAHRDENGRIIRHWKPGERRSLHWRLYEWRTARIARKRQQT